MESFRLGNLFPFLGKILFLFLTFSIPVQAFPIPIDPSESTAGSALLVSNPEGSIHGAKAKLDPFNLDALGPGELRAHLQYELATASGEWSLKYAVSKPVPTAGMNRRAESPTEFDFSENPVSEEANPVGLKIYHHGSSRSLPLLIAEYGPYQLLMEEKEIPFQTPPSLQGGVLLWGPVTFLRERAKPKTEQVSISISDPTGPFLLRLTNGTAEGTRRVSSAGIKLNGQEVFRPSEFNQQVEELRRQVILLSGENLLEVNLRSAPGSFVTLELFRLEKQACMIYNLHTFRRSKGKPFQEIDVFELPPQFYGPYTLSLTSGNPDGTQRVDSAVITLNGAPAFEPND
ncbi:MAG: hypothetical protein NTV04_24200, partial [Deltaproteobacteria bacterium]|nr:hypothetical protein [Deltaproteobacteria bacterium]